MFKRTLVLTAVSAVALLAPGGVMAQDPADPDSTAQGDVSVTIYNDDQALVQDIRQLNIASGRSQISFPDVSAQIRAETLSFNAADTAIVEQNFDFDLLTPFKMMEKAVGSRVRIVRTNPATGAQVTESAEILSANQGVVLRIGDRIEVLRDDGLPATPTPDQQGAGEPSVPVSAA